MYPDAASTSLSLLRFFVVCAALLLGAAKAGYGQRVYADAQSQATGLLGGSISNAGFAIDIDNGNFSTLNVGIGALNLMYTSQNLRFSGVIDPKPKNTSPIILKFSSSASIANLIGGISIQRTNNGINSTVGVEYTSSALLTLLNGSVDSEVVIPIPGVSAPSDGVRLRISTVLGLGLTARLYYAFYITPPELQSNEIILCEGQSSEAIISNFHTENGISYTYRLFSTETGGSEVAPSTNSNTFTIPADLPAGPYWLEARENDTYPSARTKITVSVSPRPSAPVLNIQPNSQH
jgi:hypothetical protein